MNALVLANAGETWSHESLYISPAASGYAWKDRKDHELGLLVLERKMQGETAATILLLRSIQTRLQYYYYYYYYY